MSPHFLRSLLRIAASCSHQFHMTTIILAWLLNSVCDQPRLSIHYAPPKNMNLDAVEMNNGIMLTDVRWQNT
jgi:hypothetical protein